MNTTATPNARLRSRWRRAAVVCCAATALLAPSASTAAAAPPPDVSGQYGFELFDYPNSLISAPLGINTRGDVVGYFVDESLTDQGYLWRNGRFTTIDVPGAHDTAPFGINDRGDIAGTYFDDLGFQHGFIRSLPNGCQEEDSGRPACRPVFTKFDVPGAALTLVNFEFGPGLGTAAVGLNNRRQIVGLYAANQRYSNGFVKSGDSYLRVDHPQASHRVGNGTKLLGISDRGVLVGDYATQAGLTAPQLTHGFLLEDGDYTPIDVPGSQAGGFGTQATSINIFGTVVGVYTDPAGSYRGFRWINGHFGTVDYPGAPYSEVHMINARGVLTGGYANDAEGTDVHGYLAFPR